jgi:CheY-like chemotaxis protein
MNFNDRPLSILLVEDNDDHAELISLALTRTFAGNLIRRVSDGREALDYLFRLGKFQGPAAQPLPDLILLDLRLPKVDGLEVLRTIKASHDVRRIPVVILSSSAAESDIARSYEYHANSYVVKPLDFQMFRHLMADLGLYWSGWNSLPDTRIT